MSVNWTMVLAFLIAVSPASYAHDIIVNWKLQTQQLIVTVRFDSDDPADDCEVSLLGHDNRLIQMSKTNDQGEAFFALPSSGEYHVKADAGAGHVKRIMVRITDDGPVKSTDHATWSKSVKIALGFALIALMSVIARWLLRKRSQ